MNNNNNNNNHNQEQEIPDTKYNRQLVKIAEEFIELQQIKIRSGIEELKAGAHSLASKSNIPELKKISDMINKIKF